MMRSRSKQRRLVTVLISFFVAGQLFAALMPQAVFAQADLASVPGIGVSILSDLTKVTAKIEEGIDETLRISALSAIMNGITYFVRKIAYDTATYIASGGSGQGALVFQEGFDDYLANTALDSAADAIGQIGEPFGLDLCKFPDLDLQVFLQIGLRNLYGMGPPQPSCSWQELKNGWDPDVFAAKYGGDAGQFIAEKFSASLSVQNSDFGIALGAIGKIDALQGSAVAGAFGERLEGRGIKAVKDLVTGNIKSPAEAVNIELENLSAKGQKEFTAGQIEGLYAQNLYRIFPMAASVFINTLASQLLQKILTKGILPGSSGSFDPNFFGILVNNRQAAQNAFASLLTPTIFQQENYEIVDEFAACPNRPGLNNCVIDSGLHTAINRAESDKPLTIREAMAAGLLKAEWTLVSPRDEVLNTSRNCYIGHYCYSNLQKLRKARIFPIGFEIAALKADPSNPPTLKQVVKEFDNCAPDGRPNPENPYCHLVNPNWIIKSPEARCTAKVFGPELVDSRSSERREECVDYSTCVLEGPDGECLGNYGFCTQEQNVWRMDAETCEPQFNTCKVYQSGSGNTVGYLSRTVDFGECTVDTVGCRPYSTEQDANGVWQASVEMDLVGKRNDYGDNQLVYLNERILGNTCGNDGNGCTAFYPAKRNTDSADAIPDGSYESNTNPADAIPDGDYIKDESAPLVRLQKAPDYLGCYDTNPATREIEWPTTVAEVNNNVSQSEACNEFASVCLPQEVGCEAYTPTRIASAAAIPGIIGGGSCDPQCVGYDTFKQEATNFEDEVFPLYFIPANGEQCDATYAGCDEFTNLDSAARGGESREYYTDLRYCEKPNGTNERTYYSWEGSATEGYVLRIHALLQLSADRLSYIESIPGLDLGTETAAEVFPVGSPAYDEENQEQLEFYYSRCNAGLYANRIASGGIATGPAPISDPDCRALYNEQGQIFYRLLANTVTVSDDCHALRKTNASFYVDPVLQTQADCQARAGRWNATSSSCERCARGGRFVADASASTGGYCRYDTISAPGQSNSCPARANGCRAYVGNTGRDRQIIFTSTFEPVPTAGSQPSGADLITAEDTWDGVPSNEVRVVGEALRLGEHSLLVNNNDPANAPPIARPLPLGTLRTDAFYELSFWANSTAVQRLEIYFVQTDTSGGETTQGIFTQDVATGGRSSITVSQGWAHYRLGPVRFTGDDTAPTQLRIVKTRPGGGAAPDPYFLDNIELVELQDVAHLIKDSWKDADGQDVPLVCDSTPEDTFPGEALGCTEYRDTKGVLAYASGFDALCREKAVGCEPLYDTFNTLEEPGAAALQAYNLWCDPASGSVTGTRCELESGVTAGGDVPGCSIAIGQTGCYVEDKVYFTTATPNPRAIVASTIVIPADTPSNAPVFLANRPEFACNARELGCMKVGQEETIIPGSIDASGYNHTDLWLRNTPDDYRGADGQAGTLCRAEVSGCGEFSSEGSISYFKDPELSGNGTCSYKTDVDIGGQERDGWFLDGIGRCSQNATILCRSGSECGTGNTCDGVGTVACYESFTRRTDDGIVYDMYSNNAPANLYEGKVGLCPSEADQCTELVDPSDTSNLYPDGQPYYVIFDGRLEEKIQDCEGRASLTAGCVLFDQTENPNKLYSSALTYDASEQATPQFSPVTPLSARDQTDNDSNLIVKVERDRECAEWLACKSATTQIDEDGRPQTLCYEYKLCDATKPGANCTNWVSEGEQPFARFTESAYIRRDTSWQGTEYSGYSIFNRYQIGDMIYVNFDLSDYPRLRETSLNDTSFVAYPFTSANDDCGPTSSGASANWAACGPDADTGGRCYGEQCLFPINGPIPSDAPAATRGSAPAEDDLEVMLSYFEGGSCKAFPEKDSPFPLSVAATVRSGAMTPIIDNGIVIHPKPGEREPARTDFVSRKAGFDNAGICQDGNCSCEYKKYTYKGGAIDYWPASKAVNEVATGICSGGIKEGSACTDDTHCDGGICNLLTKRETHIGLTGFCLERDVSRPINGAANFAVGQNQEFACLTWLPIDVSASNIDIFNTNLSAGYYPDLDARPTGDDSAFGQIYCTASTKVGGRVDGRADVRAAWSESAANNLLDDFFQPQASPGGEPYGYFYDGTDPGAPTDLGVAKLSDNNCASGSGYNAAACSNAFSFTEHGVTGSHYDLMQVWSWGALDDGDAFGEGDRSVVLRVEKPLGPTGSFIAIGRPNASVCTDCFQVQHLLPQPQGNALTGYGTVFHPPRVWGDTALVPGGARYNDLLRTLIQPDNLQGVNSTVSVIGTGLSPETMTSAGTEAFYVTKSSAERNLRLRDLNKVYFVPTAYPGAAGGANPDLLNKQIFIDFRKLNEPNGSTADVQQVNSFWKDEGDVTSDDSYLPSIGGDGAVFPGHVWTYKQTNEQIFLPNNPAIYNAAAGQLSVEQRNRNVITSRYVAVYITNWNDEAEGYGNQPFPPFVPQPSAIGGPPNAAVPTQSSNLGEGSDPFNDGAVQCNKQSNNWFAIGMDFNEAGEFLGYVSRWCYGHNFEDEPHGLTLAIVATLNDQCVEFSKVYDDTDLGGETNKAWTNRVWQSAANRINGGQPEMGYPFSPWASQTFVRTDSNQPFGSLQLESNRIPNANTAAVIDPPTLNALRNATFEFPPVPVNPTDGIPYACDEDEWLGLQVITASHICPPITKITPATLSATSRATAKDALFQLFARTYRIALQEDGSPLVYSIGSGEDRSGNTSLGTDLEPPQIYSLNSLRCFGQNQQQGQNAPVRPCTAGEANNFTVNERNAVPTDYNRDGVIDEDADRNGIVDPIIEIGLLSARAEFFAFADDDRMPLRHVIMDWNDNSVPLDKTGLYKNRKPFCSDYLTIGRCATRVDATELSGVTCEADVDCPSATPVCVDNTDANPARQFVQFGDATRACTEGRFVFTHDYTCTNAIISAGGDWVKRVRDLDNSDAQLRLTTTYGLTLDEFVCAYQPQVQVRDNWGYCNGTNLTTGEPFEDGLYDGPTQGFPCRNLDPAAWTPYSQEIIVIPN